MPKHISDEKAQGGHKSRLGITVLVWIFHAELLVGVEGLPQNLDKPEMVVRELDPKIGTKARLWPAID